MSVSPLSVAYLEIASENNWPCTVDDTKITTFFQDNPEKLMEALVGPNPVGAQRLAHLLLQDGVITLDSLILPDELATLGNPPAIPSDLVDAIDIAEIEQIFLAPAGPPGDTKPPTQRKRVSKETAMKRVIMGLEILHRLLKVTGNVTQSLKDFKLEIMGSTNSEQDKAIIRNFIARSRM